MAIVMRYYKHPDFSPMTYNGESIYLNDSEYETMAASPGQMPYNCSTTLIHNQKKTAMLIRMAGMFGNSHYGVEGNCNTWTTPSDLRSGLSSMGFSNGGTWNNISSNYYTVLSELKDNGPVIFYGRKSWAAFWKAHLWVADGVDSETYEYTNTYYDENGDFTCQCVTATISNISFNWGWGGAANAFYLGSDGVVIYVNAWEGYDTEVKALTGIRP